MKEIHRMGSLLRKGCIGTPLEVKFRSRPLTPAEKATGEGAGEWGSGQVLLSTHHYTDHTLRLQS